MFDSVLKSRNNILNIFLQILLTVIVMSCIICYATSIIITSYQKLHPCASKSAARITKSSLNFPPKRAHQLSAVGLSSISPWNPPGDERREDPETGSSVQDLSVPDHWSLPQKALAESEWLRVTLHKWLDDEYCPEATNVEISQVAATSYYDSLLQKEMDLGVILLSMVKNLESISYQESFHGAFSSANAAISLIIQRIDQEEVA